MLREGEVRRRGMPRLSRHGHLAPRTTGYRLLTMAVRRLLALALLVVAVPASAEPPHGSITIERIADIKYPTVPGGKGRVR